MEREFRIIYTSDTHGHIFPVDYASGQPERSGLLNMASQIQKDGNTLVIDGGDSLQGTPLSQYYLEHRKEWNIHPVAAAFNEMGLDYFTLGNHDFNFGYDALKDYLSQIKGTCLCANVKDLTGELPILPWTVHTLENGIRIGITGIVTDYVNIWEQPKNLENFRVTDAYSAAEEACSWLKSRCDVTVCIYHGGFEKDLETGRLLSDSKENVACKMAENLSFDLLLTGHQHMPVEGVNLRGTFAVQPPANAGWYLSVSGKKAEEWISFQSQLRPAGDQTWNKLYGKLLPLEKTVQDWLDQPVGELQQPIIPEEKLEAALYGSRVADLFNQVQLEATGADFSCTSLGNIPVGLSSPVTMRGVTAAYLFANTLVVLEVTKDVLRQTLERCASYFELKDGKPVISDEFLKPKIEHYNYDFYAGLSYTFDLRKPVGSRVVSLSRADGSPLGNGTYRLCTSNYRATGTGGYDILKNCPVLYRGAVEMPALTADYIRRHSPVSFADHGTMKIIW